MESNNPELETASVVLDVEEKREAGVWQCPHCASWNAYWIRFTQVRRKGLDCLCGRRVQVWYKSIQNVPYWLVIRDSVTPNLRGVAKDLANARNRIGVEEE